MAMGTEDGDRGRGGRRSSDEEMPQGRVKRLIGKLFSNFIRFHQTLYFFQRTFWFCFL